MVTSKQCFDKWGDPLTTNDEGNYMIMWDIPTELEIGVIPKKLYCNKEMILPLTQAFKNLISTGYVKELKTWDGCFNIRKKKGLNSQSLHSWGYAIDMNSSDNILGKSYNELIKLGKKPFTEGFLKCFRDAGFDCGGDWQGRPDRMHFQISKI
jgi:hypothetical protein